MIGRDGASGLVCLAGSLALLWATRGLPHPALVPIGPAFYPRILLLITAGLSAALVVSDLRAQRQPQAPRPAVDHRLVLVTFAVFTAYVVLLPVLGFRVSTVLFVAGLAAALEPPRGHRRWIVPVVALGTTVACYYVFEVYLSVLLPRGSLTGF